MDNDSMTSKAYSLPLILIAAVSPSNGIGSSGGLPWRLSGEMAYFRRVTNFVPTYGNPPKMNAVLMGRNTWQSIPTKFRPLKGRINVVISSKATENELGISQCPDTHLFPSLSKAIEYLQSRLSSSTTSEPLPLLNRAFLIGGAQLYTQLLSQTTPQANYHLSSLLLTRIFSPTFSNCDVFIPEYRSRSQISNEYQEVKDSLGQELDKSEVQEILEKGLENDDAKWRKVKTEDLNEFIGEKDAQKTGTILSLAKEKNKEKGQEDQEVEYEFQMWVPNDS